MTPDFCAYNLACQPWWFGVLLGFTPVLLIASLVLVALGICELLDIILKDEA